MGGQALRTVYEGKMKLLSWKNALRALIWGGGAAVVLGVIGIIWASFGLLCNFTNFGNAQYVAGALWVTERAAFRFAWEMHQDTVEYVPVDC